MDIQFHTGDSFHCHQYEIVGDAIRFYNHKIEINYYYDIINGIWLQLLPHCRKSPTFHSTASLTSAVVETVLAT